MKQYTTTEQTAKLIELGFEKPSNTIVKEEPIYREGSIIDWKPIAEEGAYSIGELIEMLPLSVDSESNIVDKDYYMLTIRGNKVMYCDPYIDFILMEFSDNTELVDNLFDMVVFLKEEGLI